MNSGLQLTQGFTKNEVNIELGSSLAVGAHTIVVDGYKDYAGFNAPKFEGTINVVADTKAPEVTTAEALSATQVKVTFNEPVQTLGTVTIKGVSWTVANSATDISADKKSFTLTAPGSTRLDLASTVEEKLTYVGTTDMEGNVVTAAAKASFTFKAQDDTVAPTATITADKDNNVVITFSEKVSSPGKVTIKDKDGKVIKADLVPVLSDLAKNEYKVEASTVGFNTQATAANYTVVLSDATDDSIRQNEIADTTQVVAVTDKAQPSVENALVTRVQTYKTDGTTIDLPTQITVYFSETMDASTIGSTSNYTVSLNGSATPVPLSSVTGASATAASNGKSVVLTIPNATDATDLYALALKDVAGNLISGLNSRIDVDASIAAPALTTIGTSSDNAQLVATNKVKVKFTNPMSFVDPSEFTIVDGSDVVKLVGTSVVMSEDNKTATITLNGNLNADGTFGSGNTAVDLKVKNKATGVSTNTKDIYGGYVTSQSDVSIADLVAPTLLKVEDTDNVNEIKFTFSEAIQDTSAGDFLNSLVLKNADGDLLPVVDASYTEGADDLRTNASKEITLTIEDGALRDALENGANTITIGMPAVRGVEDIAGNDLAPIDFKTLEFTVDNVAPTLALTNTSANAPVITSTERLYYVNNGVLTPLDSVTLDQTQIAASGLFTGSAASKITSVTIDNDATSPSTWSFTVAGAVANDVIVYNDEQLFDAEGNLAGDTVTATFNGTAWTVAVTTTP